MTRNITIAMDEDLAAWLRVEAAKAGKSVSRFVAERLSRDRKAEGDRIAVLERFTRGPGYAGIAKSLPARDDLYDR